MGGGSSKFDTSSAEKFGTRIVLFGEEDGEKPPSPFTPDAMMRRIRTELLEHRFDPEHDYIVLTGSVLNVGFLMLTSVTTYTSVKALMFDSTKGTYFEKRIRQQEAA